MTTPSYDFKIVKGDTLPVLQATLTTSNGTTTTAFNLTGATSVTMHGELKDVDDATPWSFAMTVTTAASGVCQRIWSSGQTATLDEGEHKFWITAVVPGGTETFPNTRSGMRMLVIEAP